VTPAILLAMNHDFKVGIYRHFKGAEYKVIGLVRHSESEEWMVLYHPISMPDNLWVRPLKMFLEVVPNPAGGEPLRRFCWLRE
jgi:hypothetical protein